MSTISARIVAGDAFFFFRGRVAQYAALKALGIGEGDEVAIQGFTCLAVPVPILALGAVPLYIDADYHTLSVSVEDLERKINDRTRAIILQHTFGIPGDIPRVTALAERYGIPVIEDCCHGIGSEYAGREIGTFGLGAFQSYEWGKPLPVGIGGTLVVNGDRIRERVEAFLSEFRQPGFLESLIIEIQYFTYKLLFHPRLYWHIRSLYHALSGLGFLVGTFKEQELRGQESVDYRKLMTRTTYSRVIHEAKRIDDKNMRAKDQMKRIDQLLKERNMPLPWPGGPRELSPLRYPLHTVDKKAALQRVRDLGIEASDIFNTPVHPLSGRSLESVGYHHGTCPKAEELSRTIISLPLRRKMSISYLDRVRTFLDGLELQDERTEGSVD